MFALALFAWGCDSVQEPVHAGLTPGGMVVMSTTGETYVVAEEMDPSAGSISAVIGQAGGEITLGANTLYVSEGAVSEATTFAITRNPESALRVELSATRETENDVGAAGFNAPVTLKMGYANAESLPGDLSTMTLIYYRPDGLVETLPTSVDVANATVTATLPHFSLFGPAWP